MEIIPPSIIERFWKLVQRGESCWIWQGTRTGNGYGSLWVDGRNVRAHRLSVLIHGRDIPDGMSVDHVCHVPLCVNPAHLRVVTHKQNMENRRGAHCTSTTGLRGVEPSRGRFRARVRHDGRNYSAGPFDTAEEAAEAAAELRAQLFTHSTT